MDKERTIYLYKRLAGEFKSSFDEDYSFFLTSVESELLVACNRKEIPEKYHNMVDDLIAYTMLLEDNVVSTNSSSSSSQGTEAGTIKSVTVGGVKAEFSDGATSSTETSSREVRDIGNKYISLKRNLISSMRLLKC